VPNLNNAKVPTEYYRPEQRVCSICASPLKRHHILWHKTLMFSSGPKQVVSWAYRCPKHNCRGVNVDYRSAQAEGLHLKYRGFSRELIVHIGYRRFWQHQPQAEIYNWLSQDLHLTISARSVVNLMLDFLALLRAGQGAKIRQKLQPLTRLIIGLDGMQPEKGNTCLYIVRELQCGVTLLAEPLTDSSHETLSHHLLEPLKELATELRLTWGGVVSDAQESIRLAVAASLSGVPHQACQSHCLRDAGQVTFEADRALKKSLKAAFRAGLTRLRKRIRALPETAPVRAVLLDYALALQSTLLEGGVAPFELGGLKVFDVLADLEASLLRCQKKGTTSYCGA
jgi:DNA-binding transcriptional ArsR family regulator